MVSPTLPPAVPCPTLLQGGTPETSVVGRIDLGDCAGGEVIFIPSKPDDDVACGLGEEDDGFLATFVSPIDGGKSGKQSAMLSSVLLRTLIEGTTWGRLTEHGVVYERFMKFLRND